MINKIIDYLIDKRIIVLIIAGFIALVGIFQYNLIPKQENPDTSVAAALIQTIYPGANPEEVEKNVTNIIEEELSKLDNIDYYVSISLNSASVIMILFDMDNTIEDVKDSLFETIDKTNTMLPNMAMESVINTDLIPNNQFIISLSGENYSDNELVLYAENIADTIEDVEGIESVIIDGQKAKQVTVEVNNELLKSYGISIETILQVIQAQNISIPSGNIEYDDTTFSVVTPGVFDTLKDIENTVIGGSTTSLGFIKLKDVANIYIEEVGDYYYYQDGNNAILLTGTIEDGKNAVMVGKELRNTIDVLKTQMPDDLIFHEAMYAPQDIDDSINSFALNLIESIILIIIVVMIGVRLRNAIVISVALPLSILATFIAMYVLEIEFQFISIAALIVSLGILVDNAIVMSEAIQQNLNNNLEKRECVINAIKSNFMPILTSTLTTIITFSIIYFLPGVSGKVAAAIPSVVNASLIASFIVSMCVTPVLAYMFFKPETEKKISRGSKIKLFISKALNFGIMFKKSLIIIAISLLGLSLLLVSTLGLQFFPVANKPVVYMNFFAEGMSIQSSEYMVSQINEIVDEEEIIDNYTYAIGKGLPDFFLTVVTLTPAPNTGQYLFQLNEEKLYEQYDDIPAFTRDLQQRLDSRVSGGITTVKNLEYSMPAEAKISYVVSGDPNEVSVIDNEMVDKLKTIDGTTNVRATITEPQYDYKVNLDSDNLSSMGLVKAEVLKQINTSLMGASPGSFITNDEEIEIVVKSNVKSLDDLKDLFIVGSVTNTKVTLDQISDITLSPSIPKIEHYDGENYVYVLSDVLPGYSSFSIESQLASSYIDNIESDVSIKGLGEVSNMFNLIGDLCLYALIAVFIIYLILYLQFKNLKLALIILCTIPLSLIGCGFGLWIFNMDIQVMALLGLVSLFGIVVNNGIILVEVMKDKVDNGIDMKTACLQSVSERYRAILMSSITTCIGLVPLIFSNDAMIAPMASVLLFGLLFSTMLTMIILPTLFASVYKNKTIE